MGWQKCPFPKCGVNFLDVNAALMHYTSAPLHVKNADVATAKAAALATLSGGRVKVASEKGAGAAAPPPQPPAPLPQLPAPKMKAAAAAPPAPAQADEAAAALADACVFPPLWASPSPSSPPPPFL
jgi:hypothetical protein